MEGTKEIRLTPEVVRKIEEILTTGKTVEIAERHEKVVALFLLI